jgi:tetratricopeptide (TPR) repeat protein/lysophospholipase L1-like esterase
LLIIEICFAAGDHVDADRYASILRTLSQDDPVIREKLVRLMLGAGQIERARRELDDAVMHCSALPGLLDCQAELAVRDKKWALAVDVAREVVRLEPDQIGRRERLGMLLAQSGQVDEAAAVLTEILALEPRRHVAQQTLVDLFSQRGDFSRAVQFQRESVDIEPTNARTRERLIRLLVRAGDSAAAQAEVEAAIALFPRDTGIWLVGSEVAEKLDQIDQALELSTAAGRLAPRDPTPKRRVGDLLIRVGRYEEAIAAYTAARGIQPQHKGALWGLVDANLRRGAVLEAVAFQRERIAMEPGNPALLDFLGFLLLRAGEVAVAETELDAAIMLFPGNAQLLQRRSEVAEKAGNFDQALDYAKKAAEVKTADCSVQERVGFLLVKMGRFSEAERQFRRVLQLDPQRIHVRRALADAMLADGNVIDAIVAQRSLVADHPADVQLRLWQIISLIRADEVEAAELALDAATAAVGDDDAFTPWRLDIVRRQKTDYTWLAEPGDETPGSFWLTMHHRLVSEMEALRPRVLFLGDSITQAWGIAGRAVWTSVFAPLPSGNAGIAGERTQGLLWRLDNGALPSAPPELVVLLIGTNNIPYTKAEYVARGIQAVIAKLVEKLPDTKLLFLGLLPRGAAADDRFRLRVNDVNRLLQRNAGAPHLRFVDLGATLLEPDGTLSPTISPDGLHFSSEGYERLGRSLAVEVHAMLDSDANTLTTPVKDHADTMLDRPIFMGVDTLDSFEQPVFLQIDLALAWPPHGLWIFGWTLDPFGIVKSMALRCGGRLAQIDPKMWISISRVDVLDAFADKFDGLNVECGFLAYLADVYVSDEIPYIEIETNNGSIGFKSIAAVSSLGIDTIMTAVEFARYLCEAGKTSEARAILRRTEELQPEDPIIAIELAVLEEPDWEVARARWQNVVDRFPENGRGYIGLGKALIRTGQPERAELLLQEATERFPNDRRIAYDFAQLASDRRDWEMAIARWERYRIITPNDAAVQHRIGEARWAATLDTLLDAPAVIGCFQPGESTRATGALTETELVTRFESLGENCEFGLVQRYYNAEPLGLLRFAGTTYPLLLKALEARFEGVGDPEHTILTAKPGEYIVSDRRYGMVSHTFINPQAVDGETLFPKQCKRLRFLRSKMLNDLARGEKIFVVLAITETTDDAARALHVAMQAYGHVRLLVVRAQIDGREPGTVEDAGDGLMFGYLDRYGRRNGVWDISFDAWLEVCRCAHHLARGC